MAQSVPQHTKVADTTVNINQKCVVTMSPDLVLLGLSDCSDWLRHVRR
jgi:hypothetical protein